MSGEIVSMTDARSIVLSNRDLIDSESQRPLAPADLRDRDDLLPADVCRAILMVTEAKTRLVTPTEATAFVEDLYGAWPHANPGNFEAWVKLMVKALNQMPHDVAKQAVADLINHNRSLPSVQQLNDAAAVIMTRKFKAHTLASFHLREHNRRAALPKSAPDLTPEQRQDLSDRISQMKARFATLDQREEAQRRERHPKLAHHERWPGLRMPELRGEE